MVDLIRYCVFLSYSTRHRNQLTNGLAQELRPRNCDVWYDRENLIGGDQFLQVISRRIHDCSVFVCLLSNEYLESDICKNEDIPIYPPVDLGVVLADTQYVKVENNDLVKISDEIIKIINSKTIRYQAVLNMHAVETIDTTQSVTCLKHFTDSHLNTFLISGSFDGRIKLWNPENGEPVRVLRNNNHNSPINCLELLPNNTIASASQQPKILIWNLANGLVVNTLENNGHSDGILCLKYLSDYKLASGSYDTTIKIWNITNGLCEGTLKGHTDCIRCLEKLNNNNLASAGDDSTIRIWNPDFRCVLVINAFRVCCLKQLTNGYLASGNTDGEITIWEHHRGASIRKFTEHTRNILALEQFTTGFLLSGSDDRTIKIWDLNTGTCVRTITDHVSSVTCIQKINDTKFSSGSFDMKIIMWQM